jgi:hypothetical protein
MSWKKMEKYGERRGRSGAKGVRDLSGSELEILPNPFYTTPQRG